MSFFDKELEEQIEQKVNELGYLLVKLNQIQGKRKRKVEVIIHSQSGVRHGDCAKVTNAILNDEELDARLGENYVLEVSSPGIYRKLKTLREFRVFQGKAIEYALRKDSKPAFGILKEVEGEQITIENIETGNRVVTDIQEIEYAKLTDDRREE